MKNNSFAIILCAFLFSICTYGQIDNEANFYTAVTNANYNKNLVVDYGTDNDFATDDSATLQTAINDISANGGGVLTIPGGNYSLSNIDLKSNVHLDFNNQVVIRPSNRPDNKNYSIFNLGSKASGPIENVSISCSSGGRFKFDLTQSNNLRVTIVGCSRVKNFILANFNVDDVHSVFSAIGMGGDDSSGVYLFPENGIVKDININNAHYGYGTVQTQSAENVLFKDLSSTGGVTLRFETGYVGLNNLQGDNLPPGVTRVGGLNKMVGRNISNTNGNAALMVSPHSMHNGTVDVEGITSVNSGFAVRLEGGYVPSKYRQDINLTPGTFEFVRIKDVTSTFGTSAELKWKHFKYLPSEFSDPTTPSTYDNVIIIGPSIAPVLADTNYKCKNGVQTVVIEEPIVGIGFLYQEDIITDQYLNTDCSALSVDDKKKSSFNITPNPASQHIEIKNSQTLKTLKIYNVTGMLVKSYINSGNKDNLQINLDDLSVGLYIVKAFESNSTVSTKKLIIN